MAVAEGLPIFMRIGDQPERQVGSLDVDRVDGGPLRMAELFRDAAAELEQRASASGDRGTDEVDGDRPRPGHEQHGDHGDRGEHD